MSAPLARPLDPAWIALVDRLAPKVLGRDDRRGEPLVSQIRHTSELYTRERGAIRLAGELLAARLRFFLLRDLPKIEGPLAELAAVSALPAGPVWRVLDLGAGLGASVLGAASIAKRLGGVERLEVVVVERDASSLDVLAQLAREAAKAGLTVPIVLDPRQADLESIEIAGLPKADLVLLGFALNELYRERGDRPQACEAFLRELAGRLNEGGSLVIVEPAIRSVTRELQMLRDRFAAEAPPSIFAPCLRDAPCPLLVRERDFCHDQLPFELPEPLAKLAEDAGLRTERLTYSYLTLRNDRRRLWDIAERDRRAYRIVGGPVGTKGKTEWDGCGEPGLVRLRLLDRERVNDRMDGAARGTIVRFEREPDSPDLRLRPDVLVERLLR
jgi:ribosomal protein RSM22 (predicted rRNA methylase)